MNRAIAPGAHELFKGRGGLRAKILGDGELRSIAQIPVEGGSARCADRTPPRGVPTTAA
jgi:hypothetical protein